MQTPSIAVIIPVYNMSSYLPKCLDSVLNQSMKNIEIICIDDGSTDDSLLILERYSLFDNRIKIIKQNNLGSGYARNSGILNSNAEYIAFMDADDWYPSSDILESMYSAIVENDVPICGGSASHWDNGYLVTKYSGRRSGFSFNQDGVIKYSHYQCPYSYWRFLYNRSFLVKNKILFPEYKRGQDMPFFVNAMLAADSFYALTKITYCYRVGHKKVAWNSEKANDFLHVLLELFQVSKEHNLKELHMIVVKEYILNYIAFIHYGCYVDNPVFDELVSKLNNYSIDRSMLPHSSNRFIGKVISLCSGILFKCSAGSFIHKILSVIKCYLLQLFWEIEERGVVGCISAANRRIHTIILPQKG